MHDLTPLNALGRATPATATNGGVTLKEVPEVALASVAARLGREADTAAALQTLTGAPAPGPGQFTGDALIAFWMGPDQFMIEAPFDSHEDIAAHVKNALGDAASVTEQTDGWTRFDIWGDRTGRVFELLCPLDLRRMTPGAAQRTRIHHLGCFVLRRTPDRFSVYGPRASAGSLWHALHGAMIAAL